ncbi:MAG: protein kinase [Polyangiaceae bacterium]|jgi:serine/threonine-protein kinase
MDDSATQAEGRSRALLGRTIAGKFLIESYLGGGAMGAVYKARQVALDKDVAIKVLHGEHAGDAMFAARFQREAKAASKLDHPNSMRVLDFGQEPDGLLYIAMELLAGRDLFHVILEDWPISTQRAADILTQALAALAVAHDMGIVHRDLKPENIMLMSGTDDEGQARDVVKVCDFGIAKFTDAPEARTTGGGQKLTTQGIVVGTPEYMSPEQGKGEMLDARSDLYSMGVILYQLMTGRLPFDAETALGVVLKHVTEEPIAPRKVNPGADARLEAVCLKAMRKKREERYQSARDMRADLRAVIGASDPLAHAATAQFAPVSSADVVGHAPTALAIDSGQVVAATASKLTPGGTVSASVPIETRSRGRALLGAVAVLALGAAGFVAWRTLGRPSGPPPVAAESFHPPTAAPPTTLESLRADKGEVPPLVPTPVDSATTVASASVRPAAIPAALATGKATAGAPIAAASPPTVGGPPASAVAAPPPATTVAPPPVASVVPAAAPTATQAAPAPPPFDPSHAHVDWSVAGAGGGATPGAVQRAVSRVAGAWTQCYRSALGQRSQRIEGSGVLHMATDEAGNVVSAQVRGIDALPGVKGCIAGSARVRIDGVDTGDSWADIALSFRAE